MNKKVLIVDDDKDNRITYSKIFKDADFSVESTSSGKEALSMIEKSKPDLMLIDVVMPDIYGTDLCTQIKTKPGYEDIIIILISSLKISTEDYLYGLEIGAGDYIRRPIVPKELIAKVNSLFNLKETFAKSREADIRIFNQDNTKHTAAIFEQKSIKNGYSKEFKEFTDKYSSILNEAVEQRFYKDSIKDSRQIESLALELGFLKANARDVIDLHKAALLNFIDNKTAKKAFYVKEESRILLVELLGYLLNFYRNKSK